MPDDNEGQQDHPDLKMMQRLQALGESFRPTVPIDRRDLFAGRISQLAQIMSIITQAGRHGIVFGERGVGKTSLAAVSSELMPFLSVKVNADPSDTFASLWTKVADELIALSFSPEWEWGDEGKEQLQQAIELLSYDNHTPDRVRHFLRLLSRIYTTTVYIDEFDRIIDSETPTLVADTIKMLSDNAVNATLILVGVADDVGSLIREHASIERALGQISMPRMSKAEIQDIYHTGFGKTDITPDKEALDLLVSLPQGLPHFAHLLGQESSRPIILRNGYHLTAQDVKSAVEAACHASDASMIRTYVDAITSPQVTLFKDVLLACALTETDQLGFFSPTDIRPALERLLGEPVIQARYARHLVQFCIDRGPVLERRGGENRWRYRFINPMMRPYIVMRAYSEGVPAEALSLNAPEPNEPEPLFEQSAFDDPE